MIDDMILIPFCGKIEFCLLGMIQSISIPCFFQSVSSAFCAMASEYRSASEYQSAKILCQIYLGFNIFVQILQLIDSLIHIFVLIKLYYSSTFVTFAAILASFCLSCLFKAICFNVSNDYDTNLISSDLIILLSPFGNILYLFKYKKHCNNYLRIYQLYKEYNRILKIYFYNKKIIQINNILLFAKCYINHYGQSLFDCFLHEIFESFPCLIFLFLFIINNQEYNNFLYNLSILISFLCIICQLFTYLSSKFHMHRCILFTIYLLIIINFIIFFNLILSISCCYNECGYNPLLQYLYYIKYKYLTLPLSLSISILYILKNLTFIYNNNRSNINQSSFKQFLYINIYLITSIIIYCILFFISSIIFDIFLNTIWFSFIIHRIYNQRFNNKMDENNKFWRTIIHFINNDKDIYQRLFAVNSVLASKSQYFPNQKLSKWMNHEYKNVYYYYYLNKNKNKNKNKNENISNFAKYPKYKKYNDILPIFKMVFIDEFFIYYFKQRDTLNNIRQFFYDFVNFINICNIIHHQQINLLSEIIYFFVYYFTIYIGVTLYILSRIITFLFPIIYFINNIYTKSSLLSIKYLSLPLVFSYLYFIFLFILFIIYLIKFRKIVKIIWNLCPGYYHKNSMYLKKIENYYQNNDLQQNIYKTIIWYYNSHKNAPKIAKYLFEKFGVDVSSVITMYLPSTYQQYTQIKSD